MEALSTGFEKVRRLDKTGKAAASGMVKQRRKEQEKQLKLLEQELARRVAALAAETKARQKMEAELAEKEERRRRALEEIKERAREREGR